jgi:phosphoglycolate phosphatase-like HAD superfamily hydrolase
MLRMAIFDLTWTLVGYRQDVIRECTLAILREHDPRITPSDVDHYLTLPSVLRLALRDRWGVRDEAAYVGRWADADIVRRKLEGAWCQPDAVVLRQLAERGVRLTLVSSSPPLLAVGEMAIVRDGLGCWPFEETVIASRDSGMPMKPAPDVALRLMAARGVRPEETIMVGDDADDIRFGQRAGTRTAWIDRGTALHGVEPDHRLRSLEDLLGVIGRMC